MTPQILVLLLATVATVYSACDNHCSGHGTCNTDDVCMSDVELQGAFHLAQLALVIVAPGQAFADVTLLETSLHLSCCEEDFNVCQVIEALGGGKLNGCVIQSLSEKVLHKHSVKALLLPQLGTLPWILSTALFQVFSSGLANLGNSNFLSKTLPP